MLLDENVQLKQGTPPGSYELKVRVTDSLFPDVSAISYVHIEIEELETEALTNSVTIRLVGKSTTIPVLFSSSSLHHKF